MFRAWGRVGTTIGGNKLQPFHSKDAAKQEFAALFEEKTGNEWGSKEFVKQPDRFYPIELDYGDDESDSLKKQRMIPSDLTPILDRK